MNEIVIIIPAYEPDEKLTKLIGSIKKAELGQPIIVVDDGSGSEYSEIFDGIKEEVHLYTHHVNMGKGRALKDAMNMALNLYPELTGCVTIDSDGQHSVKDMVACMDALRENPESLVLGCRDFDKSNVPGKSRFGNRTTSRVLKMFTGLRISDTQTGLRAISRDYMKFLLCEKGERYEFETNMLLSAKENEIPIIEVPIETIYLNDNKGSHFNPLKDSLRIYAVFAVFIIGSVTASILDMSLFQLFCNVLKSGDYGGISYIVLSTYIARIVSSMYNFIFNYKRVFKQKGTFVSSMIKYYILAAIIMTLSGFTVARLHEVWPIAELAIKIPVDVLLFLVSAWAQKEFVYKKK